ncbi:MAG: patatin-like phospholipase family protein [Candidatus Omnitrophica bacterium]|nr:patatin-like phospholipase family protein [Candidatus Omnitrophota bacterium]
MFEFFKKKRTILCLGGGAARAIANIGVLKVLDQEKIPIDLIIGSSMGALVGAAYSVGRSVSYMIQRVEQFDVEEITDITLSRSAFTKGERLNRFITEVTDGKSFKDCKIPLAITATDLNTGEEYLFRSSDDPGNMQKIVQASCSWPAFFPPLEFNGKLLADGGIKNSVPVKWAREIDPKAYIIAVKTGFEPQLIKYNHMLEYLVQTIQIMGQELDRYQSLGASCVIEPDLHEFNQLDFAKIPIMLERGELACRKKIKKIKRRIDLRRIKT